MIEELSALVRRHTPNDSWLRTPIPNVSFVRSDNFTMPVCVLYRPMLCLALQGKKRIAYGDKFIDYGSGSSLVVSIDMPITGAIVESPYLALVLDFDPADVAQMHVDMDGARDDGRPAVMTSAKADPALTEAMHRLAQLIERPNEIKMLAPLITREILFRVLNGEQGAMLREIALNDSRMSQVARAVNWIRENYSAPLRIESLAKHVGMSATSLHRHFKATTNMSPLQYQKQLRLQEARTMLIAGGTDVGSVSAHVGYASTTQFTREYSRLFGAPPRRDAERSRSA